MTDYQVIKMGIKTGIVAVLITIAILGFLTYLENPQDPFSGVVEVIR